MAPDGGSDDLTLLRDTWFDWLVARGSMREVGGLLTSRPDRPAPVAVTDPTVRDLGRRLAAHRDLVLRVLTGRAPSADLLDVPSLRPSRLMAEEPALAALWEELAVLVLARARELPDRRLVVVDVGGVGADNDILRRAMDVAGADHVEVPAGRPRTRRSRLTSSWRSARCIAGRTRRRRRVRCGRCSLLRDSSSRSSRPR